MSPARPRERSSRPSRMRSRPAFMRRLPRRAARRSSPATCTSTPRPRHDRRRFPRPAPRPRRRCRGAGRSASARASWRGRGDAGGASARTPISASCCCARRWRGRGRARRRRSAPALGGVLAGLDRDDAVAGLSAPSPGAARRPRPQRRARRRSEPTVTLLEAMRGRRRARPDRPAVRHRLRRRVRRSASHALAAGRAAGWTRAPGRRSPSTWRFSPPSRTATSSASTAPRAAEAVRGEAAAWRDACSAAPTSRRRRSSWLLDFDRGAESGAGSIPAPAPISPSPAISPIILLAAHLGKSRATND